MPEIPYYVWLMVNESWVCYLYMNQDMNFGN